MGEFKYKNIGETRAKYLLRLATENNDRLVSTQNKSTDDVIVENYPSMSEKQQICYESNQSNIIIEAITQIESQHDYDIIDIDNVIQNSNQDLAVTQEETLISDANISHSDRIELIHANDNANTSLVNNIMQEQLEILNLDSHSMVHTTKYDTNKFAGEINTISPKSIEDVYLQVSNNDLLLPEQALTSDTSDQHSIADNSDIDSTFLPDNSDNVSSGSDEDLNLPANDEEERNLAVLERQEEEPDQNLAMKQCTRKRLRNPDKWEKSIAKKKRNTGLDYMSAKKKQVEGRKVRPPCSNKCRLKCRDLFSQEEREKLHRSFWDIGDINRQRDYFLQCMEQINPKYRMHTPNSNRSKNYAYYFEINGKRTRVCKSFYLKTLDISNKLIFTATKKKDKSGILQPDMRGKHKKGGRKVSDNVKEDIRHHIKSFPTMPSHYCRAHTNKQYIDGSLNIALMYRLYKTRCEDRERPFAKQSMYETIFNTEFNIGFYIPKKDQCMICESFKNSTQPEMELKQENYDKHMKEKNLCRLDKEKDIKAATLDYTKQVACFDLQAVLSVPCGDISAFYYKRRLATYNFTIYDIVGKQGFCFTWHEGLGKRGANEIGSCLYVFLKHHTTRKNIIFYSDNCAGQNKNKFIVSLLLHCANSITSIDEITYKFLVVWHRQNEGDAMHALIEREKKRCLRSGPIYTPDQLIPIIRLAKKTGNAYKCIEMNYNDFFDIKSLQLEIGKNFNQDVTGEKIQWNEICTIKVTKSHPYTIFFKKSYDENKYKQIDVRYKTRRSAYQENIQVKKLYTNPVKISQAKKKDLVDLCNSQAIPSQYWNFYKDLPCITTRDESEDSDNA